MQLTLHVYGQIATMRFSFGISNLQKVFDA
jgi:hypothetical protein